MAPGSRTDPYLTFNFLVEIEGLLVGGFSEVTGLQVETMIETYREGGLNDHEHKLAGPSRYPSNLVLKHGLTDDDTLWNWHQDVTRGIVNRKNGSIILLDSAGDEQWRWNFTEAYPVKWVGPDLRGGASEVAVEALELVHHGLSKA
jgi:phage tail-like protein